MTPPPTAEVVDALKFAIAPSLGATVGTFAILSLAAWGVARKFGYEWRKATPAIAVLALAAGLAAGNYFRAAFPWLPDGKFWHWAWPAIGLVCAVEFLARIPGVGVGVGHLFRGTAAGIIAAFLVPIAWQTEAKWWIPAVAGVLAVQWAIVDAVGRRGPGGSLAACLTLVAWGASVVLIHDKSLGRADIATMALAALGTLAVAAWVTRSDTGSAAAAASVIVPVLLLIGWAINYEPVVPRSAYRLVGLAPSALGLFLLPGLSRYNDRRAGTVLKLLVVLIPVALGVYWTTEAVPDPFGEPEEEKW
jgi:hypothetical protein